MFAGTPESYDERPLARSCFDQVPAGWDDTSLLAGSPGQEAVLARRSGDHWFLGGVYAGAARSAAVPLAIGPGRWLVETIEDGADGLVRKRRCCAAAPRWSWMSWPTAASPESPAPGARGSAAATGERSRPDRPFTLMNMAHVGVQQRVRRATLGQLRSPIDQLEEPA